MSNIFFVFLFNHRSLYGAKKRTSNNNLHAPAQGWKIFLTGRLKGGFANKFVYNKIKCIDKHTTMNHAPWSPVFRSSQCEMKTYDNMMMERKINLFYMLMGLPPYHCDVLLGGNSFFRLMFTLMISDVDSANYSCRKLCARQQVV